MEQELKQELIKKYQWAGKIRFLSFTILFLFLLLMKVVGGYSYLNLVVISLIFVEAALNRPYRFLLDRVDIYRFQFYQMAIDIIAISWVLYYMGGIEAPVINLGYYVIILWAGVVSDALAVFFAAASSAVLFSAVVLLGYFGILPRISFFNTQMPAMQMLSLLLGNVSFLFAFGYFCARSSEISKQLERKKQEEPLRYTHKFLATGYLVAGIAHDIINHLVAIRAYVRVLLERLESGSTAEGRLTVEETLKRIEDAERDSAGLLAKLMQFSQNPKEKFRQVSLHQIIDDSLELTAPVCNMSNIKVAREFIPVSPVIMADKDRLQEVFVVLILNAVDAMPKRGKLTIKTGYSQDNEFVEVRVSDTGVGIKREHLERMGEPFFTTKESGKGLGMGLTIAYEIVTRHKGNIEVTSAPGEGATFTLKFPIIGKEGA